MALINCPECGKEISDSAPTCPHCGYLMSEKPPYAPRPTEIGELRKKVAAGVGNTIFGIVCILISIPFIGVFGIGIGGILFGGFALVIGYGNIRGVYPVKCPHCGNETIIAKDAKDYKCSTCKKRSVREGNLLKPLQ